MQKYHLFINLTCEVVFITVKDNYIHKTAYFHFILRCKVNTAVYVYAVLIAMEDVITEALKSGEIVRLGDLGTLQIGISSKGAETEEDFDDSLIKKARINFRPGSAIVGVLSNLTYAKVKPRYSKADAANKEEEEGGEDLTA